MRRYEPPTHPRKASLVAASVLAGTLLPGLTGSNPAGAAPPDQTELFVRQAYTDVVRDADPDPADVAAAVAELDAGTSPAVWLWNLLQSAEGRSAFISDEYLRLLDRPADPGGLSSYVARMDRGATRANVRGFMVGSNEYFRLQGGTDAAFVDAAFRDLLGRDADPAGRNFWIARLEAGVSRTQVANSFQASSEGRRVRVRMIFSTYLNRLPDPQGLAFWMGRLAAGVSEERIITTISGSSEYDRIATTVPPAEKVVLLTDANELIVRTPGTSDATVAVTGLAEGTTLLSIDVRPATGVLYGIGSDGQLYAINTATGIADDIGPGIADFDGSAGVGFDFNPVPDALRVITADRNYRLNANTGIVLGEGPAESGQPGPLTYAPGDINEGVTAEATGAAYTNSTRGLPLPTETALFDIDSGTDALVRQNPANDGTLLTVGSLLLDATGVNGFDVSPDGRQVAYAVLTTANGQGLYAVDLTNGEPKLLDAFDGGPTIIGLAVVGEEAVVPTETAFGLTEDGLATVVFTTTDTAPSDTKVFAGQNVGTSIVAIDVRPSTGELFALGSDGQLYTVDTSVAAVATLTATSEEPTVVGEGVDLTEGAGFDWNPAADRIRVIAGDANFRLLPDGTVVGEGPAESGEPGSLQYVEGDPGFGTVPNATGAAYTNSIRSETLPTSTALFDLEAERNALVRQDPANDGNLITVGDLGIEIDGVDGFDISGGLGQTAYAAVTVGIPGAVPHRSAHRRRREGR